MPVQADEADREGNARQKSAKGEWRVLSVGGAVCG